jgi:integrase
MATSILILLSNRGAPRCTTLQMLPLRPHVANPGIRGKLIGAKPPLRLKHVWSIRTKLQIAGRARDLAMFNLAIDSKLRGCDVVSLRVEDVAPHGHAVDRATVRQKKTGQPVRFEMTEQTREAVDSYSGAASKKPGEFLFGGRRGQDRPITTRQYARLQWIASIGLDRSFFWHALITPNQGDTHLPAHR